MDVQKKEGLVLNEITKVIVLNENQHFESILFRMQKGYVLEFHLGYTLFGKPIKIFTNHPLCAEEDFVRDKYYPVELKNKTEKYKNDWSNDTNLCYSLSICRAGTFHYYFADTKKSGLLGSGYFTVDPVLLFKSGKSLALDSIKCQTVLAKSLGKFENWENCLRVSKESGYNMIHFTPIQELGGSNSSYCIKSQLCLNPNFGSESNTPTFDDVKTLLNHMRENWEVFSMGDVVLNHTANDSPWLADHPECAYNMENAQHLIPAAILDGQLYAFSQEVAQGRHIAKGIPDIIFSNDHLKAIKQYLETKLIPKMSLHEFYTIDVEKSVIEFSKRAKNRAPTCEKYNGEELRLLNDTYCGRAQAKVDMELAIRIFNVFWNEATDENSRLKLCEENFKKQLLKLNSKCRQEIENHLSVAINNCIATMRYFRVQEDGPKIREVSDLHPLVPRYFTGNFASVDSVEMEVLTNGRFIMAHNGWVMNGDPLKNFADPNSNVYLRRELIVWGDSVKLRYGNNYSDCPFLWNHMREYVENTASLFDGIRLDNCHSTPLSVAEFFLDCARKIRPDLYVAAELFTNSDVTDNIFVNRLGITSLIREATNAWNSHELGRLVYRYGGKPVGSFSKLNKSPLTPDIPHALFYDVTHDNPCPVDKKSVFDVIPTAAIVSMACCAVGSSRGYDELVPHHISVVEEKRIYPSWKDGTVTDASTVNKDTGIIRVKKALNRIHEELSEEGYNEVYVDQMNEHIVAVTRHNPTSHESIILVSHTAFSQPCEDICDRPKVRNLKFEGELFEIILEAHIFSKNKKNKFSKPAGFQPDENFINGLTDYEVFMSENLNLKDSKFLNKVSSDKDTSSEFEFKEFYPGSILIVRVYPHATLRSILRRLEDTKELFLCGKFDKTALAIVSELDLNQMNYALYRCSEEEKEKGSGAYNVPGFGSLVYCGLQGFESVLSDLRLTNDLGHAFNENLRQGDWMLDYISGRLKGRQGTEKLGAFLQDIFDKLRLVPRYLIPGYFDVFVGSMCRLLSSKAAFQMSEFVQTGSTFVRFVAMGSVECVGHSESAYFPPFSSSVTASDDEKRKLTLCAGLPHFSAGYMRSWGRDTFISLRGLLLLTGRFEEARLHILGYAACLRHGLIPNLLDKGLNARFNCRDAVWWWLYSIVSYLDLVPNGQNIFKDKVSRIFPADDSPPVGPGLCEQPLYDVVQEALSVHFKGLCFRERNAGPEIDAHMSNEGFNNFIGIDPQTGFVFGGNEFNCGTWMDKMGSDVKTGNKGKPATPRDGSAVELVALCKRVVTRLAHLHGEGIYPYSGVEKIEEGKPCRWSFREWGEKIQLNFEKLFWIPQDFSLLEKRPDLVNRRGIYKDTVGSTQVWADYQLRCNFPIALTVAPELVDPKNAWKALEQAEEILLGPLGIKTLDPEDWNYNGRYDNKDSENPKTSQGFNYHQGPEWLWPVGYFLRAKLYFAKFLGREELEKAASETRAYLGSHYQTICESPWRGLPELTNENGSFCPGSCAVQAWSMASILEVLYDLRLLEKNNEIKM